MLGLVFVHFVSDFILQRRVVAINKSTKLWAWSEHVAIIFICFLPWGLVFSFYNALIHGIIDALIWRFYRWRNCHKGEGFKYWEDGDFYTLIGFDQFLHISTLVILLELV